MTMTRALACLLPVALACACSSSSGPPPPAHAPDAAPAAHPPDAAPAPPPPPPPAAKTLHATPLTGPFVRADGFCTESKITLRTCALERAAKRITAPYIGAQVLRVTAKDGTVAHHVAIATSSGWFVGADALAAPPARTVIDSVELENPVDGSVGGMAPLLVRGRVVASNNTHPAGLLVVCGIGGSKKPSCLRSISSATLQAVFAPDGELELASDATFLPRAGDPAPPESLAHGRYVLAFP